MSKMTAAAKKAWRTRRANELDKVERSIDRRYRSLTAAIYNPVDYYATGGRKLSSRRVAPSDIARNRDGSVSIARMPQGDVVEATDRELAAALAPRRTGRENARRHVEQIVADIAAGKLAAADSPLAGLLTDDVVAAIVELEAKADAIRTAIYDASVAEYGTGDDIPF